MKDYIWDVEKALMLECRALLQEVLGYNLEPAELNCEEECPARDFCHYLKKEENE